MVQYLSEQPPLLNLKSRTEAFIPNEVNLPILEQLPLSQLPHQCPATSITTATDLGCLIRTMLTFLRTCTFLGTAVAEALGFEPRLLLSLL